MAANAVLDSWEDLDTSEGGEVNQEALEKLNSALDKLKVTTTTSKRTKDPFAEKSKPSPPNPSISSRTSDLGSSGDEASKDKDRDYDGLRHVVIVKGFPVDKEALENRLNTDFGNVPTKFVNDNTTLVIFSNTLNARHAAKNSHKYVPMKLYLVDEAEVDDVYDYINKHRSSLRPLKSQARPATNISVVRQTISRHLNVRVPVSADQRKAEKDQIQEAKERKKAQAEIWK